MGGRENKERRGVMLDNKELHELATGVMQETPHGPTPQNTVAELAAGVIRLIDERTRRDSIFNELLVDRCALTELRAFWRTRYNTVANNEKR